MRSEELFLAVGQVESSRLMRSEGTMELVTGEESGTDNRKNSRPVRLLRNLLIAAVLISMLAVTAFAVGAFVLYDNPAELITSIFGNETGFDHSEGSVRRDPLGSPEAILVEPGFDRVSAEEGVIQEDLVPHVDALGQTIRWRGYTLTIDAFLYDSATRCGFFTYLLENPEGLPEYNLQTNGELWYEGRPDPVNVNQYGYAYIIQEKTTDTCLAATYYFQWDPRRGENMEVCLQSQERYTPEEFEALIAEDVLRKKQEMTPEEAVAAVREMLGEENFARAYADVTGEALAEQCYLNLTAKEAAEKMEQEGSSERICIPLTEEGSLPHIAAGGGAVKISSVALRVDVTNLTFLHKDRQGRERVSADNIEKIVIRYKDGTEYVVCDGYTLNYVFAVVDMPAENTQTEVFVSPEEDPAGEGYYMVQNSHEPCLLTTMFNRIVDIEAISSVILNGVELTVD